MDDLDRAVFEAACDAVVAEANRAAIENAVETVIAPRLVKIVEALEERISALEHTAHWHRETGAENE